MFHSNFWHFDGNQTDAVKRIEVNQSEKIAWTQKAPDFNIFNSISLEQSRDSGFGSFSNSIISETSCDQELNNEMSYLGNQ